MSDARIQKVLAEAGVASRRAVEKLIAEGRVKVNGDIATVGQKVSLEDRVQVDGRGVRLAKVAEATRVLLYKKRAGELVTRDDPEGRKTVFRKLPELENGRWIAVGRLDLNTSGLLLLTNDGELARRLTHPSFELEREYAVRVLGEMTDDVLERLRKGVKLEDGMAHFDSIDRGDNEDGEGANQWWRVILKEGRNREVRRLFESQRLQVSRLIRVRYGPIELGRGVKSGGYRELVPDEMRALRAAVKLETVADLKKAAPRRRPRDAAKRDVDVEVLAERSAKPARSAGKVRAPKVERNAKPATWKGYRARKPS
ncbi:MAG: pseudouridine synthase [Nevskia sp.]|nr:pseudouridine synthase [Nevskia sp.]